MTDDHEDYETGAAPAAHKVSHQDGGTDQINIEGLTGITAYMAAHLLLANVHHDKYTDADARAAINNIFGSDGKADAAINLDTHKLINVVDPLDDQDADTKKARENALTTHAGLATVHQDAPQLILDHKGDASAHHTYSEGSWTMGLAFGGGSVGITYVNHTGRYIRIGNVVTITGYTKLSSKGTSSGPAVITGLPFTVENELGAYSPVTLRLANITFANQPQAYTVINQNAIALEEITEAGVVSSLTNIDFANNSEIMVNCTYKIN